MSAGLKNVCRTAALPGASQNSAASAARTTIVLAVDTATAPRPPLRSIRDPRRASPNQGSPEAGSPYDASNEGGGGPAIRV